MLASSVSQTSLQPASAAGVNNSNWLLTKELSMMLYPLHYELASKIILPSTEEFIFPVSVALDHQNLQPMSIMSHTKSYVSPTSHKKVFRMKTSTCRNGTLKNQPNKMGTTPQHIHTIPTSCANLPTMFCVC